MQKYVFHCQFQFLVLIVCLIVLAACEAKSTPIAVVDSATIAPNVINVTQPPPLRYGIAEYTLAFVSDIEQIQAIALVESMPTNPDLSLYDVAVAYGVYEGWQQAPISHHIGLILNSQLAPIDNNGIQTLIRQTIQPQAVLDSTGISGLIATSIESLPSAQIRSALANIGYPDGFRLTMVTEAMPGVEAVIQQLNSANFEIVPIEITSAAEAEIILAENRAHLLLIHWRTDEERLQWVERAGENQIIELYTLPISYVAAEGVTIAFTDNGWPIGSR